MVMRLLILHALVLAVADPAHADLLAVRVIAADTEGPTLVVVGVEGAEGSAGAHVVRQLQWHKPDRGTLVLVRSQAPFASTVVEPGWEALKTVEELFDRFPGCTRLVLRESYESATASAQAYGATVAGSDSSAIEVLTALRGLQVGSGDDWQLREAELTGEIVVTTSSKDPRGGQRPAIRQLEHRVAALALMQHLGMVADISSHRVFPTERGKRLRVAVYDDEGSVSSSGHGPAWLRAELASADDLLVELVGISEITSGVLEYADVLVVGGGSSSRQAQGLGEAGRNAIREFVGNGGGYLGICAGAFLASQPRGERQYLGLLPVETSGNSGSVVTTLDWSDSPVGHAGTKKAKFSNGPTIIPQDKTDDIRIWATFHEDPQIGPKRLLLKGTPAVVSGEFRNGRVVIFSPHCERRPSHANTFLVAVRWAASPQLAKKSLNQSGG